ncbi:MAG TPA: hypothetical protein VLZ75_07090 [Chitinophagales bacterium]|nr:hypothetical protein [Chitinophagales bacterium]
MHKLLILIFSIISVQVVAKDFNINSSNTITIKDKDSYPIQLIHADDEFVIYTKGTEFNEIKSIEFLNKTLRTVNNIKLKTTSTERVDHIIWTGEQLIVLWEQKKKNDKAVYYQIIHRNGRTSAKSFLINLENCFSNQLKEHRVEILRSPDNEYFGFVINEVYSKKYSGKDAKFLEFTAIFNKEGKLLDKQKNAYNKFQQLEAFHFLTHEAQHLKFASNASKRQIFLTKKDLNEKQTESSKLTFKMPDTVQVVAYRIEYNPIKNNYAYISTTKDQKNLKGINGTYVATFDLNLDTAISQWYTPYTSELLETSKKSFKFSEGNILFQDYSLSNDFKIRKVEFKEDGGYFIVQEYYKRYTPPFLKEMIDHETSAKTENLFNAQNQFNTSLDPQDFIITNVNSKGAIEWIKYLPKSQNTLGHQFGSFDAFTKNEDLYLIYNVAKSQKSFAKYLDSSHVAVGKLIPICKKIDQEGKITSFNLRTTAPKNMVFYPIFSIYQSAKQGSLYTIAQEKSDDINKYSVIHLSAGE